MKEKKSVASSIITAIILLFIIFTSAVPILIRRLPMINWDYEFYVFSNFFKDFMPAIKIVVLILLPFAVIYFFQKRDIFLLEKETEIDQANHLCKTHTSPRHKDFSFTDQLSKGQTSYYQSTQNRTSNSPRLQNGGDMQARNNKK